MTRSLPSILALVLLAFPRLASACVGCREPGSDTVASEPQTVMAGFGFSWGVLIMLGCVMAIVAGLVVLICTTVARVDRAHRSS